MELEYEVTLLQLSTRKRFYFVLARVVYSAVRYLLSTQPLIDYVGQSTVARGIEPVWFYVRVAVWLVLHVVHLGLFHEMITTCVS